MGRSFFLIIAFLTPAPALVLADTLYVPQHYGSIQSAIILASSGDTILVAPRVYAENIDFFGKAVNVRSDVDGDPTTHDISPKTTWIYGSQNGRVVTFDQGEGPDSVLDGFTISGGFSSKGGGIFCDGGSSPTLRNNVVHGNSVMSYGGGYGSGGGIYCGAGSSPHIHNHLVFDNFTLTKYGLPSYGGGICCVSSSNPTITNSTITMNEARFGSGSGIYGDGSSIPVIGSSIVWDNIGSEITGNPAVTYSDIKWQIWPGTGNISQDPIFFHLPALDFHLQQDPPQPGIVNPCVDAGDPSAFLFDGSTRTDGVQDAGVIDMGYHYPTTTTLYAIPDVKANDVDSPLNVNAGSNIDVTISLSPQDKSGLDADVWVLAFTPLSPPLDWWYYDLTLQSFAPGFLATYQGPLPLSNLPSTSVFEGDFLPPGTYYFFFLVDLNMNGVLDQPSYLDFVVVNNS